MYVLAVGTRPCRRFSRVVFMGEKKPTNSRPRLSVPWTYAQRAWLNCCNQWWWKPIPSSLGSQWKQCLKGLISGEFLWTPNLTHAPATALERFLLDFFPPSSCTQFHVQGYQTPVVQTCSDTKCLKIIENEILVEHTLLYSVSSLYRPAERFETTNDLGIFWANQEVIRGKKFVQLNKAMHLQWWWIMPGDHKS